MKNIFGVVFHTGNEPVSFSLKAATERAAKLETARLYKEYPNAEARLFVTTSEEAGKFVAYKANAKARWSLVDPEQKAREERKAERKARREEREAARKEQEVKQDAVDTGEADGLMSVDKELAIVYGEQDAPKQEDKEDTLLAKVKGEGITMEQVRKSYLTLAKEGKGERAIKACAEVFKAAKTAEIQAAKDAGKHVGKLLTEQEFDGDFVAAVNAALSIKGAKIDVRGCYLWVSNTKREDLEGRAALKAAGYWWASRKKCWYWKPDFLKHA